MDNPNKNVDFEIIKHYDLLKEIGVLEQIQFLNNEVSTLVELLEESIELFNKHSIIELIDYLTKKMLNKFVPSNLAFAIQNELSPDESQIICFKNMQKVEPLIEIDSLKQYRTFFTLSPTSITFETFEVMVDDKNLTDVFIPLDSELIVPMMGLDGYVRIYFFWQKNTGKKIYKK